MSVVSGTNTNNRDPVMSCCMTHVQREPIGVASSC